MVILYAVNSASFRLFHFHLIRHFYFLYAGHYRPSVAAARVKSEFHRLKMRVSFRVKICYVLNLLVFIPWKQKKRHRWQLTTSIDEHMVISALRILVSFPRICKNFFAFHDLSNPPLEELFNLSRIENCVEFTSYLIAVMLYVNFQCGYHYHRMNIWLDEGPHIFCP